MRAAEMQENVGIIMEDIMQNWSDQDGELEGSWL